MPMATEIFKKKKSLCRKVEFLLPSGAAKAMGDWGGFRCCGLPVTSPERRADGCGRRPSSRPGGVWQSGKRQMAGIFAFLIYK